MSRAVNFGVLGLKAFTGLWALITLAVAGALQSQNRGRSDSVGAVIAAGVITLLWVMVSLALQFLSPETVVISVMVDTIIFGFLFVLALGGVGAVTSNADWYSRWNIGLGSGTIGVGWILVILLLAVVLFQVIYTLLNYGGALPTWLTPFHVLVADGSSGSGSSGTKSRASKSYGGRSGQDTSDTWEQVGGPSGPTSQRGPGA